MKPAAIGKAVNALRNKAQQAGNFAARLHFPNQFQM
jgi:hypothetical protein